MPVRTVVSYRGGAGQEWLAPLASAAKVVPRCHGWRIVRRSNESIDEQIRQLVDLLNPVRLRLISLCAEDDVDSVMQVGNANRTRRR